MNENEEQKLIVTQSSFSPHCWLIHRLIRTKLARWKVFRVLLMSSWITKLIVELRSDEVGQLSSVFIAQIALLSVLSLDPAGNDAMKYKLYYKWPLISSTSTVGPRVSSESLSVHFPSNWSSQAFHSKFRGVHYHRVQTGCGTGTKSHINN